MLVRKDSKVIAVDGSRMAMFKNIGEAFAPVLELIEEHKNPSLRTSELGTDRPGRSFQSKSPSRGAHEQVDLQQQEEDRFVSEMAQRIEQIMSGPNAGIILVAAPRALGVIRKHLGPETSARLLAEIPKNFGPEDSEPLAKMLAKHDA
ncbi:host attachment protein [uncultured Parasphingorhabdus sp.]|uniref:host attachment protein n=1 Tax=uncultured Parasphingorhabdus sp. TaxID=2709694 RepID=UPI0030DCEF58|tara:strand:- start:1768 stop:2211 length:444 start_codon:yes stop_codon:yes gene_type:complete